MLKKSSLLLALSLCLGGSSLIGMDTHMPSSNSFSSYSLPDWFYQIPENVRRNFLSLTAQNISTTLLLAMIMQARAQRDQSNLVSTATSTAALILGNQALCNHRDCNCGKSISPKQAELALSRNPVSPYEMSHINTLVRAHLRSMNLAEVRNQDSAYLERLVSALTNSIALEFQNLLDAGVVRRIQDCDISLRRERDGFITIDVRPMPNGLNIQARQMTLIRLFIHGRLISFIKDFALSELQQDVIDSVPFQAELASLCNSLTHMVMQRMQDTASQAPEGILTAEQVTEIFDSFKKEEQFKNYIVEFLVDFMELEDDSSYCSDSDFGNDD